MPTTTPKKTARPSSMVALWQTLRTRHHCGRGLLVLVLTLLFLSLLAGANLTPESRVYVAGQVADSDVIADRDILVEDVQASKARQRQVLLLQPSVYDLSMQPYEMFQNRILGILHHLNVMADHKGLQSLCPKKLPRRLPSRRRPPPPSGRPGKPPSPLSLPLLWLRRSVPCPELMKTWRTSREGRPLSAVWWKN